MQNNNEVCYALNEEQTNDMELIYEFSQPYLAKNDVNGYVYLDLSVYKLPYTESSNLYVLNYRASFTPGCVARINGETINGRSYNNVSLANGYLHVSAEKMNQGYRYSGNVSYKASWPSSSDIITTFTSSYGETLTNSESLSISIGEGGSIIPTIEGTISTSYTMNFNVSTSSVCADPLLSMQNSPNNFAQSQWSFETISNIAGRVTYHLNSYYLFEMDKTATNCDSDAFHATVELRFGVLDSNNRITSVNCPTSTYAFFY